MRRCKGKLVQESRFCRHQRLWIGWGAVDRNSALQNRTEQQPVNGTGNPQSYRVTLGQACAKVPARAVSTSRRPPLGVSTACAKVPTLPRFARLNPFSEGCPEPPRGARSALSSASASNGGQKNDGPPARSTARFNSMNQPADISSVPTLSAGQRHVCIRKTCAIRQCWTAGTASPRK